MSKGHSPLLTRGFSPILKGFPCTFLVFFTCNTLFFSQFYDVKAFIFITFELFHQNVLLDSSSIFHTSSQILLARTPTILVSFFSHLGLLWMRALFWMVHVPSLHLFSLLLLLGNDCVLTIHKA